MSRRPFLTARWESLLLLNYDVPADVLEPLTPAGTELDLWEGSAVASVVGFMFRDVRVRGMKIPGHRMFEEVNLRFYVRRPMPDGSFRRGVVFVSELVPRRLIATVARLVYNEPYAAVPMSHELSVDPARGGEVDYRWRYRGDDYAVRGAAAGQADLSADESEAAFITEHYWGYNRQRSGATLEYRVEHPRWLLWDVTDCDFRGDAGALYGDLFRDPLAGPPRSAVLAVGSPVAVYPGQRVA